MRPLMMLWYYKNIHMDAISLIKSKSGILSWSEVNIGPAPATPGFLVLRSSPINGDIIDTLHTSDLRAALLEKFNDAVYQDVKFFEWYTTDTEESAKQAMEEWATHMHI